MNAPETIEPLENFINTPDGKIHYLDWGGSGPPVHLLHANGFCAGTYSPFVKHLVDDLHVVASDIRGHGGTELPNIKRIRHWDIFADDLKTLIEQSLSPPIIGIGHSLGAVTDRRQVRDAHGVGGLADRLHPARDRPEERAVSVVIRDLRFHRHACPFRTPPA